MLQPTVLPLVAALVLAGAVAKLGVVLGILLEMNEVLVVVDVEETVLLSEELFKEWLAVLSVIVLELDIGLDMGLELLVDEAPGAEPQLEEVL